MVSGDLQHAEINVKISFACELRIAVDGEPSVAFRPFGVPLVLNEMRSNC